MGRWQDSTSSSSPAGQGLPAGKVLTWKTEKGGSLPRSKASRPGRGQVAKS